MRRKLNCRDGEAQQHEAGPLRAGGALGLAARAGDVLAHGEQLAPDPVDRTVDGLEAPAELDVDGGLGHAIVRGLPQRLVARAVRFVRETLGRRACLAEGHLSDPPKALVQAKGLPHGGERDSEAHVP